jgi:ABC-type nitrate/sulfonate/bicarbonate transport system substrate-binding protein
VKRSAHRFRFRLLPYLAFFLLMPAILLAQEKKLLRVVFVSLSWNSEIPVRVALARGIFKAQGLQNEPIFIRGGPAAIAALVSGEVDFASIGGAQAVIRSKARGLDMSIIGSISNQTNYVLLGNKQTRAVESLKGKIIGITGAGAFSEFAVKTFLKKHNIEPSKDVILRAVGNTTMRAGCAGEGPRGCGAVLTRRRGATDEERLCVDFKFRRVLGYSAEHYCDPRRSFREISRDE